MELYRMISEGRSFSGNERNCCFLNPGAAPAAGGRFANISAVSGLDFPDDGRAVALVDWDHDGDLDLWISNRNAPRLRLMRNDVPRNNHFLALQLEGDGKTTNRDAVGARVEVVLGESRTESGDNDSRPLIKTLRAGEGFLAQSSKWLHFGLGAADVIEKVIVHWPGGDTEPFSDLRVDRRYRLVQGSGTERAGTGRAGTQPERETKLVPSPQKVSRRSPIARIPMVELITVPKSQYMGFDGQQRHLPTDTGRLLLVNLWASWCGPCLAELSEFSRRYDEILAQGIEIVALSVDGLGDDSSTKADAARLASERKFPFTVGHATVPLTEDLQNLHDRQFPLHSSLPLPTSFLIDRQGRLAVIYKGPVSIGELFEDVAHCEGSRLERFTRSAPIAGQPISHPQVERTADSWAATLRFLHASGLQHSGRAEQAATLYEEVLELRPDDVPTHNNLGLALHALGNTDEAIAHYQEALRINPDYAEAHNNLGLVLERMRRAEKAVAHYQEALRINPDYAEAHNNLGISLMRMMRIKQAVTHYQEALRINPDYAEAHNNLGLVLHALKRIDQAVAHYQEALRINPDYAKAHNNLGFALQALGRIDEAFARYQEALRIDPDYSSAHNNLGNVFASKGELEVAAKHFEHAVRSQPNWAESHNNLAWLRATAANSQLRDGTMAVRLAQHAAELTGRRHPKYLDTLAAAYAEAGRWPEAVATAEEAVALAKSAKHEALAAEIQSRLDLYRAAQPYREPPPQGNLRD